MLYLGATSPKRSPLALRWAQAASQIHSSTCVSRHPARRLTATDGTRKLVPAPDRELDNHSEPHQTTPVSGSYWITAALECGHKWWSRRDFNPRPSACEADALATELRPQVEQVNGNDPSSSRWQRDALPLSYTCLKLNAPRWCSVIAQVQRGARTNTLIALSSRAQVYWCLDFPRPDHLLGALYRIIGPALVSIRARCRAKSNLKCKTKNPLTVQVSGFQNSCFVCLTRLPPELVPPYYEHTMTTEQTIPDYEGRNPSHSGQFDL